MSWLARSIANTLLIHDDDDYPQSTSNSNHHPSQSQKGRHDTDQEIKGSENEDQDRTGGVKEDLSEFTESLTRQLWGVASFLAPPASPPPTPRYSTTKPQTDLSAPDPYVSEEDDEHTSNSAYGHSRFAVGYGIRDSLSYPTSDQTEKAVGVTDEVLAFARNISHHPETWLDFPLSEEEDNDDFEMSNTQWNHVRLIEREAPRLAALRIELCPNHMSESYFWKVYFVLLHPRLKKHDADLLSTPQMVAARSVWMKELQKRSPETCDDFEATPTTSSNNYDTKYPLTMATEGLTKAQPEQYMPNDDDDDWVHELNGYVGPEFHIGTDEDISFSDLEADDDCTMPIRSKIM